jgi:hypothetical protein
MLELDVRTAPTQASHVGIEVDVFPQMHRKKQSEQHLRIRKAADRRYQAADIELRAAAAQPVSPHPPQLDSTRFVSFHHMADWEAHPAAGIFSFCALPHPGINSRDRAAHMCGTAVDYSSLSILAVLQSQPPSLYTQ